MQKDLPGATAGPLSISYLRPGSPGRSLPATVIPLYQEGGRKGPGTCRPVRPTSVSGKIMEKIVLGAVERFLKNNAVIRCHQHGSTKGESHLINLIFLWGKEGGECNFSAF